MADAPLRKCGCMGCTELIRGKPRCDKHGKVKHARTSSSDYQKLYGRRWRKAAARHKLLSPICVECKKQGKVVAAYCVDHIVPHRGDVDLFWQPRNWQSLCEQCHNAKTARGE